MGNMSNPCLNRWGSNTYWSVFWYSDNFYSKNLQHDRLFEKLLNIYLFYGLQTKTTFFLSKYWFYFSNKQALVDRRASVKNYYRWFEHYDYGLGKKVQDCLRIKTADVYMMKFWILKFVNWIVINVYWFKPVKGQNSLTNNTFSSRMPYDYTYVSLGRKNASTNIRRLKTLTSQHFFQLTNKRLYYRF